MTLVLEIEKPQHLTWPVTARRPVDGGRSESHEISVTYELIADDELEQLLKVPAAQRDRAIACRVVRDWSGVADADGNPLPWSAPVRDWVLGHAVWLRRALVLGFFAALAGEGPEKN
ncbi:hypothetical protein [Roseospirillum parvum]|uniref:Uncharacterized protein n=1 Tax=Roseospirillum parvum TaxID=83401 RepID=A0A1G8EWN3_9PROT|nr:hypothetical protein [Roseospirillum parvum]SDH74332.1 hypothetical protein SAMN05421742_11166 [Roseospirillum parvum]